MEDLLMQCAEQQLNVSLHVSAKRATGVIKHAG